MESAGSAARPPATAGAWASTAPTWPSSTRASTAGIPAAGPTAGSFAARPSTRTTWPPAAARSFSAGWTSTTGPPASRAAEAPRRAAGSCTALRALAAAPERTAAACALFALLFLFHAALIGANRVLTSPWCGFFHRGTGLSPAAFATHLPAFFPIFFTGFALGKFRGGLGRRFHRGAPWPAAFIAL